MTTPQLESWDNMSPELCSCLSHDQIEQISQLPLNPEILSVGFKTALNLSVKGNHQAAEELLRHNLIGRQNVLGTTHADTLATMHYLGLAQTELGHYADREKTYRELIPLYEKPLASLSARSNLGWLLNKEGKYDEAELELRELLPQLQNIFAEDDPRVLGCLRYMMEAVGGQGRNEDALEMNRQGMELVMKMGGEHQADEIVAMRDVAARLQEWKK